jgi:hypothetical protein
MSSPSARSAITSRSNLFKGASLDDPHGLFNARLEAKTSRAIDLHQGSVIDEPAFKDLVRAAVALSRGQQKPGKPPASKK